MANRGEIAVRIIRGARDEGWSPIAVYSDADAASPHVTLADEAYPIGPAPSHESYLNIPALMEAARQGRATHVHPGYGFLAENGDLARACAANRLTLVGPPAAAIDAMGDKVAARRAAQKAGVPVIPGSPPLPADPAAAVAQAEKIGYPVLIKAAFGGGGKGMRLCANARELHQALELTRGEAGRAFGKDTIFLERALVRPRHVEIQILCDAKGRGVYLGERECSIQRRHQKLVEETPSVAIDAKTRKKMGEAAVRLALAIGYRNAGTVEFLLDAGGSFYFLEMNTRLQVEHPVTEMTTGIDLVRTQLRLALGEPLAWKQEEIRPRGAAIECRIVAEDPAAGFLPVSGRVLWTRFPEGLGVRNDVGFETGSEVPVHYDSLLGKLITWGGDREEARRRMLRALDEYLIEGIRTNLPFLRWVLDHPEFVAGRTHTGFLDEHFAPERLAARDLSADLAVAGAVSAFRHRNRPADGSFSAPSPELESPPTGVYPRISPWKQAARWKRARQR